MNKKWMPITAGVLDIIIGFPIIFTGWFLLLGGEGLFSGGDLHPELTISGILVIIVGVAAIAGGIFTLIKRVWLLALIGAITLLLGSIPWLIEAWDGVRSLNDIWGIDRLFSLTVAPGIIAIIFIIRSRKQFER